MELKTIGNTGVRVSPIGLGTVKFGRNQQVKYPHPFKIPDDKSVQRLMSEAHALGINVLDTAPAYGNSETRIGQLRPYGREDWAICTKVGEQFQNGQSYFDFSKTTTEKSIHQSLTNLKTDYLDIVFIHSNGADKEILQETDVLDTLLRLKVAGKIRAVGISSKTVEGGILAFEMGCDVVMTAYNPLYQEELPVIQKAEALNKGIFIKKALSSGHLQLYKEDNPIKTIFTHIFKESAVSCVTIGTINLKHLRQNVRVAKEVLK